MQFSTDGAILSVETFKEQIALLMTEYRSRDFFPADDDDIRKAQLGLWWRALRDLPDEVLRVAVEQYILSSVYRPKLADIRRIAIELMHPDLRQDWSEGWQQVMYAVHRYGYARESEALGCLSETTRAVCRRIGWQSICLCPEEHLMSVRANFRDIYNAISTRQKETLMLSPGARAQMERIGGQEHAEIGQDHHGYTRQDDGRQAILAEGDYDVLQRGRAEGTGRPPGDLDAADRGGTSRGVWMGQTADQ